MWDVDLVEAEKAVIVAETPEPVDELVATAVLPEPVVAVVAPEELVGLVEWVIGLGAVILAVDFGAVLDTSFAQVEDPITV